MDKYIAVIEFVVERILFSAMSADVSGSEDEAGRQALQSIQVGFKLLQNQRTKTLFRLPMMNSVLEG